MAVKALASPQEYLAMPFSGLEPEYVRGEIVERAMPDLVHTTVEDNFVEAFRPLRQRGFRAYHALRLRLDHDLYRLPDLSLFAPPGVTQLVPTEPPLGVVEIISRGDVYLDLRLKMGEYQEWGVPNIWIMNPWNQELFVFRRTLASVDAFSLPEYDWQVTLAELMAGISPGLTGP